MKDQEYNKLREDILGILKSNQRSLYIGGQRKVYILLFFLNSAFAICSFLSLYYFQDYYSKGFFARLLTGLGSLAFSYQFFIIQRKPPDNDNERFVWLWENGQKSFVLMIFGGLLFFSAIILSIDLPLISKFAALLVCVNTIFVGILIFFIAKNPKYFLNSLITGVGTTMVLATPFFLALPFYGTFENQLIDQIFFSFLFMVCYLYAHFTYVQSIKGQKLNLIQKSVLRFLKPHQIIDALPTTKKNSFKIEKKALNILEKLNINDEFEVELILLERLGRKYHNKKSYIKGIIIYIVNIIITALLTFVVTKFFFDPYI